MIELTDDYVRDQLCEANELMGTRTFWKNPDAVFGVGKALVHIAHRYTGRWEGMVDATLINFTKRSLLLNAMPGGGA